MSTLRSAGEALEEKMFAALSTQERSQLHAVLVKLFIALDGGT
jgi:hypothetical protein